MDLPEVSELYWVQAPSIYFSALDTVFSWADDCLDLPQQTSFYFRRDPLRIFILQINIISSFP